MDTPNYQSMGLAPRTSQCWQCHQPLSYSGKQPLVCESCHTHICELYDCLAKFSRVLEQQAVLTIRLRAKTAAPPFSNPPVDTKRVSEAIAEMEETLGALRTEMYRAVENKTDWK